MSPIEPLSAEIEADGIDIEYAEIVPLAAQSMQLDLVRIGERVVSVGERGIIVLSEDGGTNWKQAAAVPARATLTTVVAVGQRLFAAGHDTVILTSGDGGDTWTRQYFDPERQQPIMDMWFSDEDNGLAIGAYGLMLSTADGGQNWEDWAVNDADDAHLNNIVELSDGTLLIAGEAGFSYRSDDAGETWEALDIPYQGSMFGADVAGDGCILFYGLRGHILRSCASVGSWEELETKSENTLAGGTSHAGGVLMVGNSGVIVDYRNGGALSLHNHSSGVDFSTAIIMNDGSFLLAGEDGVHRYPEARAGEQAQ
ncbi:MAG: YCF48-related protein [Xanthomonadales bacterium]|nr:YCF48-related protein [Xanthomonadales bacterium]